MTIVIPVFGFHAHEKGVHSRPEKYPNTCNEEETFLGQCLNSLCGVDMHREGTSNPTPLCEKNCSD